MAVIGKYSYTLKSNSQKIPCLVYCNDNANKSLLTGGKIEVPINGPTDYEGISAAITSVFNDNGKWRNSIFHYNGFTNTVKNKYLPMALLTFPNIVKFDPPLETVGFNKIENVAEGGFYSASNGEVGGPYADGSLHALPGCTGLGVGSNESAGYSRFNVNIYSFKESILQDGKFVIPNEMVYYDIWAITVYDEFVRISLVTTEGVSHTLLSFLNGKNVSDVNEDPFEPGGGSEPGGGGGDFNNDSTPVDIPSLPTISASLTGFITLFNPTLSELGNLASYMWSDLFDIDTLKKLFADPMDAILGLSILPVQIPSGGQRDVKVGNIATGITMNSASTQFVELDCGSLNVNEFWGAYLDYEPHTQAQLFLPYIGTRQISVDDIMGKTVRIVYHIDILTGACCCFVKCGESVLYNFNGQCSIPIPFTSVNYTSIINGVLSVAGATVTAVATGGSTLPVYGALANSAVNQSKPNIAKSGSIAGSAGLLNMQTPYLILTRPRQALPEKQNEFIGYPSLITVQLSDLTGYTEVDSIHLENIGATSMELDEIEKLLKEGVIF